MAGSQRELASTKGPNPSSNVVTFAGFGEAKTILATRAATPKVENRISDLADMPLRFTPIMAKTWRIVSAFANDFCELVKDGRICA